MDKIPTVDPMDSPPQHPLAGLDPADLLKQGIAADTLIDGAASSFDPPPLEEIATLFPQFEILSLIGKGGMGAVYKVRQNDLDRVVALKILPPAISETPGFSERFTREAKALAKLNHPGIVTLHEFGQRHGLYFILMEFVDGVNLGQLMQTGRISPREALAIVPQICDALQFAHDQGIIHRDIKPENILLDRLGRVKVADFGIAKVVSASCDCQETASEPRSQTDATLAGKIIGTPQYMAPEQLHDPAAVDHRADIYALGVVFYQMLTGELPGKRLEAPSKKVQIDVRLDEIVLRALEKDPALRYPQVSLMKTRVESCAENSTQLEIPQAEIANTQTAFDRFSSDGGNWYFYFIYFNREDPRLIVPKRMVGWTLNLAQPLAIPLLAAISLATLHLLDFAHRLGVTGHGMLGVKLAILVAVVWLCHSLSTARRKPPSGSIRHRAQAWHSRNSRWVACCVWAVVGLSWYGYIFGIPHEMRESAMRLAVELKTAAPAVGAQAGQARSLAESFVALDLEAANATEAYLVSDPAYVAVQHNLAVFIAKNPEFPNEESLQVAARKQVALLAEIDDLSTKFGTGSPPILELNRQMEKLATLAEIGARQFEIQAAEKILAADLPLGNRLELRWVSTEADGIKVMTIETEATPSQPLRVSPEIIVCDRHIMATGFIKEKDGDAGRLQITLNEVGAKRLADATKAGHGTLRLAILIDGKVESAPVINGQLGKQLQISESKNYREYLDLLQSFPIWNAQKNSLETASWLMGIDEGNYAASYATSAAILRARFSEKTWDTMLARLRKPLGTVTSRSLKKYREVKAANGSPTAADYRLMLFDTHFSNKRDAIETVTFIKDADGSWRAAGYYIR